MNCANTLKTAVACAFLGAAAVASTASTAQAQPEFDRTLAKVLADKAAAALGDLRLGSERDTAPAATATRTFFGRAVTDSISTGSIRAYKPRASEPEATDPGETRWLLPRTDIRIVYAG